MFIASRKFLRSIVPLAAFFVINGCGAQSNSKLLGNTEDIFNAPITESGAFALSLAVLPEDNFDQLVITMTSSSGQSFKRAFKRADAGSVRINGIRADQYILKAELQLNLKTIETGETRVTVEAGKTTSADLQMKKVDEKGNLIIVIRRPGDEVFVDICNMSRNLLACDFVPGRQSSCSVKIGNKQYKGSANCSLDARWNLYTQLCQENVKVTDTDLKHIVCTTGIANEIPVWNSEGKGAVIRSIQSLPYCGTHAAMYEQEKKSLKIRTCGNGASQQVPKDYDREKALTALEIRQVEALLGTLKASPIGTFPQPEPQPVPQQEPQPIEAACPSGSLVRTVDVMRKDGSLHRFGSSDNPCQGADYEGVIAADVHADVLRKLIEIALK